VSLDVPHETVGHRVQASTLQTHTTAVPPVMNLTGTLGEAVTRGVGRAASASAGGEGVVGPRYREVFYVTGDLPGGYRLRYALPVVVEIEASEYVAEQPQLALHAFGETPADAILSLRDEIVEHYTMLTEAGERVSPRLSRQRDEMRRVLAPPDA
jgi:hypothetical protein